MGHEEYLDRSYWRVTTDELGKKFLEGQNAITIMGPQQVISDSDIRVSVYKGILESMTGLSREDITKLDIAKMTAQDLKKLVTEDMMGFLEREYNFRKQVQTELREHGIVLSAKPTQMVVSTSEVEKYISEGYTFVAALNGEKAIMQVPPQE